MIDVHRFSLLLFRLFLAFFKDSKKIDKNRNKENEEGSKLERLNVQQNRFQTRMKCQWQTTI